MDCRSRTCLAGGPAILIGIACVGKPDSPPADLQRALPFGIFYDEKYYDALSGELVGVYLWNDAAVGCSGDVTSNSLEYGAVPDCAMGCVLESFCGDGPCYEITETCSARVGFG